MGINTKRSFELLDKMLGYYNEIEHFINGMTLLEFHNDIKTVRAVTNNILQIGELSKRFEVDFKVKYGTRIDWENLRETRNLIAHDSENVSHKRLWDTATYDLKGVNDVLKGIHYEFKLLTEVKVNARINRQDAWVMHNVASAKGKSSRGNKGKMDRQDNFKEKGDYKKQNTKSKNIGYSKYDEFNDYDLDTGIKGRNTSKGRAKSHSSWN